MTDATAPLKPKRRFWQIHLSTLLCAVLLMGGFMAVNFFPDIHSEVRVAGMLKFSDVRLGWPRTFKSTVTRVSDAGQAHQVEYVDPPSIFVDALVATGFVGASILLIEYLIRRRKPQP
jgi:hypothetical protein